MTASKKLAILPQQLIHMCMFDYIGYEVGTRGNMTAADLIEAVSALRNRPYYFKTQDLEGVPEDLRFISNHAVDWGTFAPRWGRVQGLMRSLL